METTQENLYLHLIIKIGSFSNFIVENIIFEGHDFSLTLEVF